MKLLPGSSAPSQSMELPRAFAMFDDTIRRIFSEVVNPADDVIVEADPDVVDERFGVEWRRTGSIHSNGAIGP